MALHCISAIVMQITTSQHAMAIEGWYRKLLEENGVVWDSKCAQSAVSSMHGGLDKHEIECSIASHAGVSLEHR
jgi:hypothetical protein